MGFLAAALPVLGQVASTFAGSRLAGKAAGAGVDAADAATREQQRQFDAIQNNLRPQQIVGTEALYSLADIFGLSRPTQNQFSDGTSVTRSLFGSGGNTGGGVGFLNQANIDQANAIYNLFKEGFRGAVGGGDAFSRRFIGELDRIEGDPRFQAASPETRDAVRLLATIDAQRFGGNLPGVRETESEGFLGSAFESAGARGIRNDLLRNLSGGSRLQDFLRPTSTQSSPGAAAGPDYSQFFKSPDYNFRLNEGIKAVERSNAARGLLNSGNTLRGVTELGQNLAAGEYNNFLSRLFTLAGYGNSATSEANSAATNFGQQAGNNAIRAGEARASGFANRSNAFQQGAESLATIFGGQNAQNQQGRPGGINPFPFFG